VSIKINLLVAVDLFGEVVYGLEKVRESVYGSEGRLQRHNPLVDVDIHPGQF
jgi:hypothetical protein